MNTYLAKCNSFNIFWLKVCTIYYRPLSNFDIVARCNLQAAINCHYLALEWVFNVKHFPCVIDKREEIRFWNFKILAFPIQYDIQKVNLIPPINIKLCKNNTWFLLRDYFHHENYGSSKKDMSVYLDLIKTRSD